MTASFGGAHRRFDLSAFLFNAAGRSGRTSFLLAGLVAPAAIGALLGWPVVRLTSGMVQSALSGALFFFLFVVVGVAVSRRLHDLGLAGWWFAPLALYQWLCQPLLAPPASPLWWLGVPLVVAELLLLLWPGQPGFNRFGPRPA